ncbi:MAG: cyclomaltodextrinase C-terminal domain-containing protein, partial [Muribaculaceae bacterium]|nr:cyclomaltodextrinase C-terminal domain-containing protein [Muribaculaceae bacterium]
LYDPYVSDYDLKHTVDGWFVKGMPDLNQRNPHLMKYLIQNSIWWIESSKINGIRMDTYPYADMMGMARWIDDVEKEYPDFNIVGECWYNNEGAEAFWQRGSKVNPVDPRLETVMDFKLAIDGRKYFMEQTDPWNGLNHLYDHLSLDYLFPDPQKILTFLDNHDTDRFLPALPDSLNQWKQAQTFLLTSRGIPQIYYGTELLMNGAREGSDGYVRRDVPGGFPGDAVDQFSRGGRTPMQNEAFDFLSMLLHWRKGEANEVIAHGSLKHFMPQNGVYVYRRKLGDKEVHVLMNGNDAPLDITMERTLETLPYGSEWTDIISGQKVTIEPQMKFAPRQIMILQNF